MPRTTADPRSQVIVAPKSQGFYAAAKNYTIGGTMSQKPKESGEGWQSQGWGYYDTVPEFHYAVNWVGNLLSRARLIVKKDGKVVSPEEDVVAAAALSGLFGGPDGQQEMFRQLGIHLTVAGEAYILGLAGGLRSKMAAGADYSSDDEWYVVASTEISLSNGTLRLWGHDIETDAARRLVMRLWRPHPQMYFKADCPTRAALPILEEIVKLSMHVAAQLDSRLASAGILLLPSEMDFSSSTPVTYTDENGEEQTREVSGAQAFNDLLVEVASTAIKNRSDASALVPIVLQVPGDTLQNVKHLRFWTELDAQAENLRTEAIRRLSLGLDMPPEVLTGTGDMNHWGAWQVDESAIKSHSEPLLQTACSSLKKGYLEGLARSILSKQGLSDEELDDAVMSYSFDVDTAEMRMRPNRSKEALELFKMGQLKASTARRENGFDEDDAPSNDEIRRFFLEKVAAGSTTPEIVASALEELGVVITIKATDAEGKEMQEARPTPSLREHPERKEPDMPEGALTASAAGTVLAASEVLVYGALKRAGNKLKNRMQGKEFFGDAADRYLSYDGVITARDADDLLEGSWTALDRYDFGVGKAALRGALHDYSKALLTSKTQASREQLAIQLAQIVEED